MLGFWKRCIVDCVVIEIIGFVCEGMVVIVDGYLIFFFILSFDGWFEIVY